MVSYVTAYINICDSVYCNQEAVFAGKVDEKAFEEMIIGKQSEILSTKGALRHKMDERNSIVRSRLSPKAAKEWVLSGFGLRRVFGRLGKRIHKKKAHVE